MNHLSFKKIITIVLLTSASLLSAQITEAPLTHNPNITAASQLKSTCIVPTLPLNLPFFEDFVTDKVVDKPSCLRWKTNAKGSFGGAYINNNMGKNASSIGVATLDGLNDKGKPYDPNLAATSSASADTLTSLPINTNVSTNLFLYFEYQKGGNGDKPEAQDSLVLEFLNSSNNWVGIRTYQGLSTGQRTDTFYIDTVTIAQAQFKHNNFQFRYRNYATISANMDHWHLDYIYLSTNAFVLNNNRLQTSDLAIRNLPASRLAPYTAMPLAQFEGFASTVFNTNNLTYTIFNRTNTPYNPRIALKISETCNNTNLYPLYDFVVAGTLTPNASNSFTPTQEFEFATRLNTTNLNNINSTNKKSATIITETSVVSDGSLNPLFRENDKATCVNNLSNYFSYDDGSAESSAVLQNATQTSLATVAVGFKANKSGKLRGFHIHVPYTTVRIYSNDYINVKAWVGQGSLTARKDTGSISDNFIKPIAMGLENNVDSVNGWWTFAYSTPQTVTDSFYIGFQSGNIANGHIPLPVGLDKNQDNMSVVREYYQGAWHTVNPIVKGTLMIRPILDDNPIYISSTNQANQNPFVVYPNPSTHQITLEYDPNFEQNSSLIIRNALGQEMERLPANISEINIENYPSGLYYITNAHNSFAPIRFMKN